MTGENKKQFEIWLLESGFLTMDLKQLTPLYFYRGSLEMQIGVYLAYYDSLGLEIKIEKSWCYTSEGYNGKYELYIYNEKGDYILLFGIQQQIMHDSLNEAYKEAFKKANELINKQLCSK